MLCCISGLVDWIFFSWSALILVLFYNPLENKFFIFLVVWRWEWMTVIYLEGGVTFRSEWKWSLTPLFDGTVKMYTLMHQAGFVIIFFNCPFWSCHTPFIIYVFSCVLLLFWSLECADILALSLSWHIVLIIYQF